MKSKFVPSLVLVTIIACAMAYLEGVVMCFACLLYFPGGFTFPLTIVPAGMRTAELLRETATIVIFASVAILAGRNRWERTGWFFFAFGIWDIGFYLARKILSNWPSDLFAWDLLFLVPVVWVAPVIAPLLNACALSLFGLLLTRISVTHMNGRRKYCFIILFITGAFFSVAAYTFEYLRFIVTRIPIADLFMPGKMSSVIAANAEFIPRHFPWALFVCALAAYAGATITLGTYRHTRR